MISLARLGRLELRRAADADRGAERRAIASAADALAMLRQLRLDPSLARRLVHVVSPGLALRTEGDALRALARLVWRGTYVLLDHGRQFRIPLHEQPSTPLEEEVPPPEVEEVEDDGHPPAIVPPEYPRVASYMTSGLYAALKEAERELEEQLYRGLAPMPVDEVPHAYRDIGKDHQLEIGAAAHHALQALERMMHQEGELPTPADSLPDVYRDLADTKRTQVQQSIFTIAESLASLCYAGDTDLAMAEGTLHSNALPPVLRETTQGKVRGVRDSTEGAASRLDALLYVGFDD